jgi:Fe2+ transport protein
MAESQAARLMPSDEADERGLELGRAQGDALGRTLEHMTQDVAHDGGEQRAGEYLVAYAVEEAEGMYVPGAGGLEWRGPEPDNVHIEVAVRDAADGRFIPGLEVDVTVVGDDGREIGTHRHPLLWHPYLYHYGRNWTVPGSGRYALRIRFAAPGFPRHDRKNGRRFETGAEVTFDRVRIKTGQD